ncbi:MAG: glycosyltransferase family 2 protein [Muribaculaceae bacterium]|nr:glycosyltransferase family 2 protein [Muribaculaceae bacterium]
MSPEVTVSVLVPVYNTAPYLRECLDSIIGQSYGRLQIVLADDGSTDAGPDICLEYARRDSRVEYHPAAHAGIAAVRNRLLDLATGDYILFVDSDDRIEPEMIETMLVTAQTHNLDTVIAGRIGQSYSRDIEFRDGLAVYGRDRAVRLFLDSRAITSSLWAKLVRARCYAGSRFDADILYGEDVMMTWRLLNAIDTVGILESRFYHYRDNRSSITNRPFGGDTYSLHLVWDRILSQCRCAYPRYAVYAERQRIDCYVWLLYTAIRTGYGRDSRIRHLQRVLRSYMPAAVQSKRTSLKQRLFTLAATFFYTPTKLCLAPVRSRLSKLG